MPLLHTLVHVPLTLVAVVAASNGVPTATGCRQEHRLRVGVHRLKVDEHRLKVDEHRLKVDEHRLRVG
jgi:hypothetical protein